MENLNHSSKTYQYRKVMKPMLERKRRARINKCLDELKSLIVESIQRQGDNINRLEKADILELTVNHLKNLKTTKNQAVSQSVAKESRSQFDSFREGYVLAATEVSKTLAMLPKMDIQLGTKVMTHLGNCLVKIQEQQQNVITHQEKRVSHMVASPYSTQLDSYRRNTTSPAASSGYGSDSDYSDRSKSPLYLNKQSEKQQSAEVWRPW